MKGLKEFKFPNKKRNICLGLIGCLLIPGNMTGENRSENLVLSSVTQQGISGVVVDTNGTPLIGVSIIIKGTSKGVTTDIDGKFNIDADINSTLIFSYVGMKSTNVVIKNNRPLHIVMHEDSKMMDEIVVTGYGDFKKATYTGSASVLNTEKLESLPVTSVAQMIESNMPGVSIVSGSSSQPGSKSTLRIRGIASMNASTEPLYVIDGVPVSSDDFSAFTSEASTGGMGILETINPADVESITVLKDAASASLYGAKGANGVILIKTKKGSQGKLKVNMQASFGVTDLAYNYRPLMGGEEWRDLLYEGLVNFKLVNGADQQTATSYADSEIDKYAAKPANGYSDWYSALMKKGYQQDYNVSVSSGTEKSNIIASVGYTNQTGVSVNSEMDRLTGRIDANSKWNNFEFGANASFSWTKSKQTPEGYYYASALYSSVVELNPSIPIYNEDGTYHTGFQVNGGLNPLYENSVNDYYTNIVRSMLSGRAAYNIIEGLKISTVFSVDYSLTKDFYFYSPEGTDGKLYNGKGLMQMTDRLRYTSQNNLSFNRTFGKHNVSAVLAYEIMKYTYNDLYGEVEGYGQSPNGSLSNGAVPVAASQMIQQDALLSYIASGNYSYADKYYVGLSFRRDGSSRLAPETRWGNFWAVSGSWRVSQEKFMNSISNIVNDLKIRASYGVNGNLPSTYYGYMGTYNTGSFYNGLPAPWEDNIANNNLSWEKNYSLNLGLDISFLNRISISIDWYNRITKDLLMNKQLNSISGFGSVIDNIGKMQNKGVELEIRTNNIQKRDFSWSTSFNLSHNKNKILKLADLSWYTDGRYIRKEGLSYGTLYLREYAGVDPDNGKPMYYDNVEDENGNLSKNIVYDPNDANPIPLVDIYPKVSGGLMNTFNYKFIDLSFNLSYSLGGHSYDNGMYAIQDDGYYYQYNKSTELRRRWQEPGDITDVPRFVYGQEYGGYWNSSRGIHSTDHLRLKNLTLGISAPKEWLKNIGISNLRIFFSGTNLLTWAAYDQYDPELTGVVSFFTPPLKTFSFGLDIKL